MDNRNLKGLGGWLVLVGIGVVFTPVRMVLEIWPLYSELFSGEGYTVLTTPGSELYTPYFLPLVWTELVLNSVIFLAALWLVYLYFSKHYLFPRVYIIIGVGSFLFILCDAWVVSILFPQFPAMDADTAKAIMRGVITVFIWVPYMLLSERVKITFVEKRKQRAEAAPGISEPV